MNKFYISETLQCIFVNITHVYINPSKAKKKKVKEFIHALPHLFFQDDIQNKLFNLIQENPIESYYDSQSSLEKYLYYIYCEISKFMGIEPLHYESYSSVEKYKMLNDTNIIRETKQKHLRSLIYILIIITILYFYFKYL